MFHRLKSAFSVRKSDQEDKDSIFGILRQEHAQVRQNLERIVQTNQPLNDLFNQTAAALTAHMRGEEEYLYPRLGDNANTRLMAFQSYEKHNLAKQLLNSMSTAADSERWMAKVRVLYTIINNHITVEENQVFPKAKEVLFQ